VLVLLYSDTELVVIHIDAVMDDL